MFNITNKMILNPYVTEMSIYAPLIAQKAKAGQFVIIRIDKFGERIPLTIADCNIDKGTINIIYQKVGKTTMELDKREEGDSILDVAGPLGRPSELKDFRKAIVVGGGTGCAIAYPQAKELNRNGCTVDIVAGFRNKELIILEDRLKDICRNLDIVTDDGSNGNKGLVTDILYNKLKNEKGFDIVIAIGPLPMMRAVCKVTEEFGIKTVVSMNSIMIDGTGMCGGCRLTVGGITRFACVDGPDFDGHKVDFDEAIIRGNPFREAELRDKESYCRLTKGVDNGK